MSFNIIKILKNEVSGKKIKCFSIRRTVIYIGNKIKRRSFKIVEQCNLNSERGWRYEVRLRGEKDKTRNNSRNKLGEFTILIILLRK